MDKTTIIFVFLIAGLTITCNNCNVVEASHKVYSELQSINQVVVKYLHRTGFHFQPKQNWINDPNGPMYYKGIYHLFYQYNPKGAVWGNIVWAHSVSTDMINWQPLDHAIYPSKSFDQFGCWSGSTTILSGNKPVILYTGIIDQNQTQVQNYAIPANYSDPYLREWIKPDNNPLVIGGDGVNKTAFRDPTTAWWGTDGHYRMVVGSRRKQRGMAYLYRSKDFINWKRSRHPLHSSANTGMWECPDFYPVSMHSENGLETSVMKGNIRHVLKVSLDETRYEYYTIGTYCREKDKYIPEAIFNDGWSGLRYDYGNFYASKTFFDAGKNRRILWGWANESDSKDQDVLKGWAGIQAIPRKVWLAPNRKQLLQWPIEELETLRGRKVQMNNLKLNKEELVEIKGITAAQADVEAVFSFPNLDKAEPFDPSWNDMDAQQICSLKGSFVQGGLGPFGFITLATYNLLEYTPVFFRIFKGKGNYKVLMCSDASRSSLGKDLYTPSYAGFVDADLRNKKLSLRSLIDHSVVESFGEGGKTCITSRVYPKLAVSRNAHLYVFNNGTEKITVESINAWSMNTPLLMN